MEPNVIRSFRDLIVWQKSIELVTQVYIQLSHFPRSEDYCLCAQLRRCAVSIPSNIAEGYSRGSKEYAYFLRIARGSLYELETQLLIAENLFGRNVVDCDKINIKCKEIEKMLNTMIKRLK
jgi:four helix bundle protein